MLTRRGETQREFAERMADIEATHNYYTTQGGKLRCIYCNQPKDAAPPECSMLVGLRDRAREYLGR